eukprot:724546-Pyramimonas_sp.AAC.1
MHRFLDAAGRLGVEVDDVLSDPTSRRSDGGGGGRSGASIGGGSATGGAAAVQVEGCVTQHSI